MSDDVLDADGVAALLDCAPETINRLAREGELPGVQFGRSWRFPREALLDVLNRKALEHTVRPRPERRPQAVVTPIAPAPRPPSLPSV